MTFQEFIASIGFKSGISFWGVVAFLMSIGIEIIPKVKWKPWSSLLAWLGSKLNARTEEKVDSLSQKVEALNKELTKHIADSEINTLQDNRRDILNFCNSCMNKRKHTKEEYDFVIAQCDAYEKYIECNDVKNGVITAAIKEIKRLYEKCIQENSFLKEGEGEGE